MITVDQLLHIMPDSGPRVGLFLPFFDKYLPAYAIDTRLRLAAFLATIAEESGQLMYTRELWGPTDAQKGYEPPSPKATALGNTQPGDGRKFRGHGLIQTTGRANHARARDALRVKFGPDVPDFEASPDSLQIPEWATASACQFWHDEGCNALADVPDFHRVTRRVNGGLTHIDRREVFYARALEVL